MVRFSDTHRNAIRDGFAHAIHEGSYIVHALCIGHDDSHAIIARHERTIEQIATHMKFKATMPLTRAGIHPLYEHRKNDGSVPTPWSVGAWSVFINDPKQLNTAVKYVERHSSKE